MQYPVESLKSHIASTVGSTKQGISGTDLMAAVRAAFPEFAPSDYGCSNLRDFIRRLVPEVVAAGRRGMDYSYALAQEGGLPVSPMLDKAPLNDLRSSELSAWKTYSSPNGLFKLYANKVDGKLCVRPPGAAHPGDFSMEIPPLSAEK